MDKQEWMFADEAGNPLIQSKSIIKVEFKQDGKVASEPIEKNSFSSHNKSISPYELQIDIGFEGNNEFLKTALDQIKNLQATATVFSFVTPVDEYQNITLEKFDHKRTRENGIGCLFISGTFKEIREVELAYSHVTVASPSASSTTNTGSTQTGSPSSGQEGEVESAKKQSAARKGIDAIGGVFQKK